MLSFRRTPGITRVNVAVYFLGAFLGLMLLSLSSSLQPSVMTHLAHIKASEQGTRQGTLVLYNEVVLLPAVFLSGVIADRFGRRVVYATSFVISALVLLFTCFITSWPLLIAASMGAALASAGQNTMLSTVIADYSEPEDRGRAIAGMGIIVGLGAMLGALLLSRMPLWFEASGLTSLDALRAAFVVAAVLALATAVALSLGLSPKRVVRDEEEPKLSALIREAVQATRDPHVLLAYGAGFVSRCDLVVLGFLSLWVTKDALAAGYSPSEAAGRAGMTYGIAQSAAWVTGAFIALLFDRMRPAQALAVSLTIAAVGYGAAFFIHDSLGLQMIVGASAIGIGQIAALLGSQAYVAKVAPEGARGSVIGGFGFFGAVGTLLAGVFGGSLFDHQGESAPFIAVGLLSLGLALTASFMIARKWV